MRRAACQAVGVMATLMLLITACAPEPEPTPSPDPAPPADAPPSGADGADETDGEDGVEGSDATLPVESPESDDEPIDEDEALPEPVAEPAQPPWGGEEFPRWGEDAARLVDARLLAHDGLDRLVLEFASQLPSWEVRETQPPVLEQPMGNEVALAGEHLLEVRLAPATTLDRGATDPTGAYEGPAHLDGSGAPVIESVLTGDHSDLMVWTLALAAETPLAVGELEDPPRLVVDMLADEE